MLTSSTVTYLIGFFILGLICMYFIKPMIDEISGQAMVKKENDQKKQEAKDRLIVKVMSCSKEPTKIQLLSKKNAVVATVPLHYFIHVKKGWVDLVKYEHSSITEVTLTDEEHESHSKKTEGPFFMKVSLINNKDFFQR